MLTAVLCTIAKLWKQPKCPQTDVCICTYTHIMEYYSAIEKNEILPFVITGMNLEGIIQREISQTEKDKYHLIILIFEI